MPDNLHESTSAWRAYWNKETLGATDHDACSTPASYQRIVHGILERLIRETGAVSLLSAGSGQDLVSLMLKKRFGGKIRITLLDISPEVLAWNRELFAHHELPVDCVEGDIFRMPLNAGTFDIAFNTGVMEHFEPEEQTAMTREIMRVLRPGGHYVTANPSARGVLYRWGMGAAKRKGTWRFGKETPVRSLRFLAKEIHDIAAIREVQRDFAGQLNFLSYINRFLQYASFPLRFLGRSAFVGWCYDMILGPVLGTYLLISIIRKK